MLLLLLTGTLQHGLEGLTSLQTLNLSSNSLGASLPDTWEFPELAVLNLSANHISGQIPEGAHALLLPRHISDTAMILVQNIIAVLTSALLACTIRSARAVCL